MNRLRMFLLFVGIFVVGSLHAQLVEVRDPVFAKKIAKLYPDIMSVDSLSIDTVKAALIGGRIDFSASKLVDVTEVKYFKNARMLQLQGNQLKEMPDFTNLTLLNVVDLRQNPWSNISQLEPLKSHVQTLLIRGSGGVKIKDFSFLNMYSKLTRIELTNCSAEVMPDFNSFTGLTEVSIYNNKLTFEDLSKLTNIPGFDIVVNAFPQMKLTADTTIKIYFNKTYTLYVPIDTSVKTSTITYDFYRNGLLVQSSGSYNYKIANFSISDTGQYYVQIKSSEPKFAGKYLSTGIFKLVQMPCSLVSKIDFTATESCELIPFQLNTIEGHANFPSKEITITEQSKGKVFTLELGKIKSIPAGLYNVYVKDTNMCETKINNYVELIISKNCNQYFSPNGDGIADDFFIQGSGNTQIRNKTGQLIKEIQAPGFWDGTDKNGVPVEIGLYVIEPSNGARIKISVLR